MDKFNAFIEPTAFWDSLKVILLFSAGIINFLAIWRFFLRLKDFSKDKKYLRLILASAGSGLFFVFGSIFAEKLSVYPFPDPTPSPYPSPTPAVTPTPVYSPTPPPIRPIGEVIEEELKKFTDGQFLFNVPDKMKQGVPDRIQARISAKKLDEVLVSNLKGRGIPQIENIKVANVMKVSLIGENDAFKITNLSSEEQVVTGRDFAQWDWSLTPLSYGEQSLHFRVSATVKVEGYGEKAVDVPIIDKKVNVTISPLFIVSSTISTIPWWQYALGGTTLSAVVLAVVARLRKKKPRRVGFVQKSSRIFKP